MADTSVSAQGSVATPIGSPATIFTASGSGTGTVVGEIKFTNTNASAVTVSVFRKGTASTNLEQTFTIPANGKAAFENERWALGLSETIAASASSTGVIYFVSGDTLS
jgi:hypothetical protein